MIFLILPSEYTTDYYLIPINKASYIIGKAIYFQITSTFVIRVLFQRFEHWNQAVISLYPNYTCLECQPEMRI